MHMTCRCRWKNSWKNSHCGCVSHCSEACWVYWASVITAQQTFSGILNIFFEHILKTTHGMKRPFLPHCTIRVFVMVPVSSHGSMLLIMNEDLETIKGKQSEQSCFNSFYSIIWFVVWCYMMLSRHHRDTTLLPITVHQVFPSAHTLRTCFSHQPRGC